MGFFVCLFIGALIGYLYRYAKEPDTGVAAPEREKGVLFDPGEMIFDGFRDDWRIVYLDAKGDASERDITPKKLYQQEDMDLYIWAFCHKRDAHRWFRADRMDSLVFLGTGEVIENPHDYIFGLAQGAQGGNVMATMPTMKEAA